MKPESDVVRIGELRWWARLKYLAVAIALWWLLWHVVTGVPVALFGLVLLPIGQFIRLTIWPRWAEVNSRGVMLGRADRTAIAWADIAAIHFEEQFWGWGLVVVPHDASRIRVLNWQLPSANRFGYGYTVAIVGRSTSEKLEPTVARLAGLAYGAPISAVSRAAKSLTPREERRLVHPREVARTTRIANVYAFELYGMMAIVFGVVMLWIWLAQPAPVVAVIFGVVPLIFATRFTWRWHLRYRDRSIRFSQRGVTCTFSGLSSTIPWRSIDRIGVGPNDVVAYLRHDAVAPGEFARLRDGSVRLSAGARDTGVRELKDMVIVAALSADRPDIAESIINRRVTKLWGV